MFAAASILLSSIFSAATPIVAPPDPSDVPVRLYLSGDRRFEPGDKARVLVEAGETGFLLVLHYDTEGRVRILFPLDPRDDAQVYGGRRYEVKDRRERESFRAGQPGAGFIFVALAPEPWRWEEFSRRGNWDYDRLALDPETDDAERDLVHLLESLAPAEGFDYDVIEYFVQDVEVIRHDYRGYYPRPIYWGGGPIYCDPLWYTYGCGGLFGVVGSYGTRINGVYFSVGFGPTYLGPYYGSRFHRSNNFHFGIGFSGIGAGYTYTHRRTLVGHGFDHRLRFGQPVLVGRSRDYTIGRLGFNRGGGGRVGDGARRDFPDRSRNGVGVRSEVDRQPVGRGISNERSDSRGASAGRARPVRVAREAPQPSTSRRGSSVSGSTSRSTISRSRGNTSSGSASRPTASRSSSEPRRESAARSAPSRTGVGSGALSKPTTSSKGRSSASSAKSPSRSSGATNRSRGSGRGQRN